MQTVSFFQKVEISSTSSRPSLFTEILGLRCLKTQVELGLEILSTGDQILTAGRQWATHVFFSFNLKRKTILLVKKYNLCEKI